ncbi:MAG: hypothetical protein AB7R40_25005 [Nitrospiraceae bacterium]
MSDDLHRAAGHAFSQNLVHGDALTVRTHDGQSITFYEDGIEVNTADQAAP